MSVAVGGTDACSVAKVAAVAARRLFPQHHPGTEVTPVMSDWQKLTQSAMALVYHTEVLHLGQRLRRPRHDKQTDRFPKVRTRHLRPLLLLDLV